MKNEWTIYGQSGISDVRAVVRELEYHGGWMEDEFVTVTIKSTVPIKFKHGDYLTYRDERFSIDYDPSTIQKARKESYDEAFVYENVKLYSDWHAFKDVLFKDYVLNDNGLAYSQQAKFSFFAGSIEDLADRLQANLNRAFGTNVWKIYTPDSVRSGSRHNGSAWSTYYQSSGLETGNKDINVSCDSISCKEALKQSYDLFGLPFIVIGKNVIIGGNKGLDLSKNLEYGKEKGLYEVDKTIDDDQQVITKMFAYGASDNLPLNYYANLHKSYRATISSVDKISSSEVTPFVEITLTMDYKQSLFTQVDRWTDSQGNTFNNFGYVVKFKFNDTEITARVNNPKDSDDGKVHIYAEYSGGEDPADEPSLSKMQAFRNYVASGRVLVFTAGFDKNRWPSDGIDYGASQNYPSLLSISNLMLPGFPDMSLYQWVLANGGTSINADTGLAGWRTYTAYFSKDAQRPWIKSLKSDNIGDREGAVYFDGSDNDVEKIYPTIGSGNNTVIQKSSVSDNGYLAEGTDISFKLRVIKGTFDWNEAWNDKQEDIYVNMTSGFCCGRAFKVLAKPEKKSSYWELKLERAYDSSLGRYFPYQDKATANDMSSYAQVVANDTFVVTGIQLPQSFVDSAAIKLLTAALERLAKIDHPKVNYIPKISEIFAAKDREENEANSLYRKIRAGMMLTFKDTTTENKDPQTGNIVHETITQRIDTITIKENGNNGIPTFDVVLRNDKEEDFQQRLKNQLSAIGGDSKSSSSNQGISESDIEELTDGMMSAKLFTRLFEVYGKIKNEELSDAEDAEETLISPKDWEKVFKEDDERWESWQSSHPDEPYHSLLNIKAKRGLWTEFYMSAFGNGESNDEALELLWPLNDINTSQMSTTPKIGETIIYKGGHSFGWGKSGGLDGLELMDGEDEISYQSYNDIRTYDLSNHFLSLKNGGEIKGTVTIDRTLPNDWFNPDPTNKYDKYILTRKETEDLFEGKYVTVEYFNKLFRAQDANGDVAPNTMDATIKSIKAMFGFWTDEYISAYGDGQSNDGGALELGGLLSELNKINSKHGADGTALMYKNGSWGFHAVSGIDSTALDNILSTEYKWWGRSLVNGIVSGDIENADNIYINKNKFVNIQFNENTRYSVFGMSSDNTLLIGWGLKDTSYKTTITGGDIVSIGAGSNTNDTYGKYWTVFRNNGHVTINANDDTDATRNIFLNVGGNIKANKFYFTNNVYLEYISSGSNKGLRLVGAGFWTDEFISAYGNGTSSDGIQLNQLLGELNSKAVGYGVLVRSASGWEWKTYGGGGGSGTGISNISDASDFATYFNEGTITAKQSSKWASACNIKIASSDGTGEGTAVGIDGSAAKTLLLPSTIKATLTGNADTATKLKSKAWLWGHQFDGSQNIGYYDSESGQAVNADLSYVNNISMVGSITGCTSIDSTLQFIKSGSTISQVKVGSNTTAVSYTNGNSSNTPKLYVDGHFGVNGNVFAKAVELYNDTPYIDFHFGSSGSTADYTTRIIESAEGVLNIKKSSGATGLIVSNSSAGVDGDYIRIGGATLTWVAGQGLKINTGFWSESFMSAYGNGTSSSGGIDIDIRKFQLSGTNLELNINGISKKADLSGLIPSASTLTIIEGNTTKTWNPLIDGNETITIGGGVSGDYLPLTGGTITGDLYEKIDMDLSKTNNGLPDDTTYWKGFKVKDKENRSSVQFISQTFSDGRNSFWISAYNYDTSGNKKADKGLGLVVDKEGKGTWTVHDGESFCNAIGVYKSLGSGNVNNLSGSFFFSGNDKIKSGYDYVGIQVGSSNDKWQITAIDGLQWRQNDNGGTNTSWGGWATILDSNNYSSYVKDTTDTAGIYQSANEKLYLIGSKKYPSQDTNAHAQTYENSGCYIGTDNCLYSNSNKVMTVAGGTMDSTTKVTNLNADLLDGYEASNMFRAASSNFSHGNSSSTYMLIAEIYFKGTNGAHYNAGFSALFTNRELLEHNSFFVYLSIRRVSLNETSVSFYYTPLGGNEPRKLYVRSTDNNRFYVYLEAQASTWNTFYGLTKLYVDDNSGIAEVTFPCNGTSSPISGNSLKTDVQASKSIAGSGSSGNYLPLTGGKLTASGNNDPLALDADRGYTIIRYLTSNTARWSVGCDTKKFYWYSDGTSSTVFSILNNGNVGIGETNPSYKLQVSGTGYFTDNLTVGSKSTKTKLTICGDQSTGDTKGLFITASDNTNRAYITWNGNVDSADYMNIHTGWGNVCLTPANRVLIGTTAFPTTMTINPKMYVSGTGYFTGELYDSDGKRVLDAANARNYTVGLRSYSDDGATNLGNSVNLNNVLAAGTYCCQSGTIAATQSNTPYKNGNYRLWHIVNTGVDGSSGASNQYSAQIILAPNEGRMFIRSHSGSSFGSWNEFATTGNTVTISDTQTISGQKTFSGNLLAKKIQMTASNTATYLEHTKLYSPNATMTIQGSDSAQNLTLCAGGGNVAVGASSIPSALNSPKLYVNGNSALAGSVAINTTINTTYKLNVSGSSLLAGDVYIGTSYIKLYGTKVYDNSYVLDVSAAGMRLNNNSITSDLRKKDIVSMIGMEDLTLENVARAPIFNFKWKQWPNGLTYVGTEAQYWQTVLPNAVLDLDDVLSLDYGATALASAVTVARTVLTHDDEIKALKKRIKDLEDEVELLKAA